MSRDQYMWMCRSCEKGDLCVAGDGQWFGRIGCKSWIIDVPVVQYFGLTRVCVSKSPWSVGASPSSDSLVD